ncbi:MAG: DUF3467 domain-containing protein [Myxococcota bacterium]|jgi:hypothetical protein|nr:DUF3467 domain-containing protein [Myxococcota bacterium]
MSENTPADRNQQPSLQIQIDEPIARGVYANLTLVSTTDNEFVLDFAFIQPSRAGAKVQSRVIVSPRQAKRLAMTLADAVNKYEQRFGEIALLPASEERII